MSSLFKEIESSLNKKQIDIENISRLKEKLIVEYNSVTEEYRNLFQRIKHETDKKKKEMIEQCEHDYIRYSEYHNERYFICEKCGNEKY